MKKHGFTLTEILIALAIIGVVSALTLPGLMTNYQEKTFVTQLQTTYNLITNAAAQLRTDEQVDSLAESSLASVGGPAAFLQNYFDVTSMCTSNSLAYDCTMKTISADTYSTTVKGRGSSGSSSGSSSSNVSLSNPGMSTGSSSSKTLTGGDSGNLSVNPALPGNIYVGGSVDAGGSSSGSKPDVTVNPTIPDISIGGSVDVGGSSGSKPDVTVKPTIPDMSVGGSVEVGGSKTPSDSSTGDKATSGDNSGEFGKKPNSGTDGNKTTDGPKTTGSTAQQSLDTSCFSAQYRSLDKSEKATPDLASQANKACAKLATGASVCIDKMSSSYSMVSVDVNGPDAPNIAGRDYFTFYLLPNGSVAESTTGASVDASAQHCEGNSADVNAKNARGCFSRIVKDGWKMTY